MVGNKVVEVLIRRGATRTSDITVVGDEPQRAYDRVHLSQLFEGADPSVLDLVSDETVKDPAVTIVTGEDVTAIDRDRKVAVTSAGREIHFDTAVLATGSSAFVPPVPGRDLPGTFVYRTVDDVDAIRRWASG